MKSALVSQLQQDRPHSHEPRWLSKLPKKLRYAYQRWGWKALAAIFVYYLVRDVTLYIIIPALVVNKVISP
jgi:hypothetical protein